MSTNIKETLVQFTILLSLSACGSGGGGGGGEAPAPATSPEATKTYTMVVNSDGELPACGDANSKQLVYVKDTAVFKSCDSGTWTEIAIKGKDGASGSDGLSIVSNELLSPYGTNICTMYSSIEACYFNGGQLVKFSDGSSLVLGAYSYELYVSAANNGGSAEYDRMANPITMVVPPAAVATYQRLDWEVSHGTTSFKHLYLTYTRPGDVLKLVFDSNGSNTPDAADTVIHTVVKAGW